jgi:hypothetical protein
MAMVYFRTGKPITVAYTPAGGNVNAGDVVVLGNTAGLGLGVAPLDIPNGTLGDLTIFGGIYDVVNESNAANWAKVYWDATNSKVTTTSTNNALFGYVVSGGGGGANTTAQAFLDPTQ